MRELIHTLHCGFMCLQGTQSKRIRSSCCGVQQGDPLGPLAFALVLHPIIEKYQGVGPQPPNERMVPG
ncbi:hypothetical protein GBAR_LOCUS12142, partial [Geodia barretti]